MTGVFAAHYYYGFYYDWTYVLVLIGAVLCLAASAYVRTTFQKYSSVRSRSNLTGEMVARRLLQSLGLTDVRVEHISGSLTDHYDPREKVVRLSDAVYGSTSVAAIGVAAHECGHAIQHDTGYAFLQFRSAFVPVANFGSKLAWPLIIIGLIIGGSASQLLIELGIVCFSLAVLFQLITLPVEFNASGRALRLLESEGILGSEETKSSACVLRAAALTYVASAASVILQLLRLIILFGGRRRNDD